MNRTQCVGFPCGFGLASDVDTEVHEILTIEYRYEDDRGNKLMAPVLSLQINDSMWFPMSDIVSAMEYHIVKYGDKS